MTYLNKAAQMGYPCRAAEKEAAGIGSPEWSGDEPHSASNAAFLSPWHPQFWAAGREEPQGSPVLHRYFRLPFGLPSQSEVGMAVHNRNWSHIMQTQTPGAFAPTILPTSINWHCYIGIILHYERRSAAELVASGLLSPDEIPENRSKQSRNGALRVHIAKGGTYNVRIEADDVLMRDLPFKMFLGRLLADTRLSLIKGESHV